MLLEAKPKCKSVANMPKGKRHDNYYRKYSYDPDAATLDSVTSFLLARAKFYPEKAKENFQSEQGKYAFEKYKRYKSKFWRTTVEGVNNPYAADFDPSDPGDMIFLNPSYDIVAGELEKPGKPFCLTTLHWKEGWVDEVRSK